MVYAVFVILNNELMEREVPGQFSKIEDISGLKRAFSHGLVHFFRWGFAGQEDEAFEHGKPNVHTIIRLSVDTDKIAPTASDNEVRHTFTILLHDGIPFQEAYASNQEGQRTVNITFHNR